MASLSTPDQADSPVAWIRRVSAGFVVVEHVAYTLLGIVLSLAAAVSLGASISMLWSSMAGWTDTESILGVVDELLFVLMLIEILHTVRASLSSGALSCEPFLVVALIASIRRVLVITLQSTERTSHAASPEAAAVIFRSAMIELGVLAMLILVMVGSIVLLSRSGYRRGRRGEGG